MYNTNHLQTPNPLPQVFNVPNFKSTLAKKNTLPLNHPQNYSQHPLKALKYTHAIPTDDDLLVACAEEGGVGRGFEEDVVGEDLGTEILVVHCA